MMYVACDVQDVAGQDFFFFVSAVPLSTIILLVLLSSTVSLSYFNLAIPIFYSHTEWNALFGHQYSFVVTCLL